jgi:vacuolar-type H+-ATPase subunit I/STV1
MVITSMGVFGFLSKSHLQQGATSSNNTQQISIINSQIKTEQDVIDRQQDIIKRNSGTGGGSGERVSQLRDKIKQLDKEVEAYTSQGATSTIFNDKVAKGVALKESQKAERDKIDAEIKQLTTANQGNNSAAEAQIARSQQKIQQLINQRAPLQTTQISLDAEIGHIKYNMMSTLFYSYSLYYVQLIINH